MQKIKNLINRCVEPLGIQIINIKKSITHKDILADESFMDLYNKVSPFTMTSIERCYSLYLSVHYIINREVPGDFVECGVWRGGSGMLILYTLQALGVNDRKLYMYDTYEGMAKPTDVDGFEANNTWQQFEHDDNGSNWCLASLDEVRNNIVSTGYPADNVFFVKGKVEDTIPATIPSKIALLRLDTDWYESTKHELVHLFPLLETNGTMIIDDYGHWQGARRAVDEYFANNKKVLLHRIDHTGRAIIKNW